jgi:type IV pilus biogenesis protein CpaD/CtpE
VKRPILAVAAVLIFAACAGTDASSTTTASPSETTTSTGPQPITATDAGLSWWNDRVLYEVVTDE